MILARPARLTEKELNEGRRKHVLHPRIEKRKGYSETREKEQVVITKDPYLHKVNLGSFQSARNQLWA